MSTIGINIGSISVKIVELDEEGKINNQRIIAHQGQPKSIVEQMYKEDYFYGVAGQNGHISESEAIDRALAEEEDNFNVIVSLGGEAFAVYLLKNNRILNVLSHNRCAAGSGEFLIQQIGRLNLKLERAIELAMQGKSIHIASRCSVHCKSDITHKLNKGEASVEDILYSVHESMVTKIISLINKSQHPHDIILVIGGLSQNKAMTSILQDKMSSSKIIVKDTSACYEAYGAALLTMDQPRYQIPMIKFNPTFQSLPQLAKAKKLVTIIPSSPKVERREFGRLIMGIDGGSTTTKIAVVEVESGEIVASYYNRTNGDPIKATKECLEQIITQIGSQQMDLVATTGSAREIIAAYIGTPAVYNEISAHATGALSYDPEVETIFEIGGQDSKYIYIENKSPVDYAMNAACSAGTGSFLEESASGDLGISVREISDIAMQAETPVQFKAECAAFINSDIRTALQEGYGKKDIIGGLVSSIVNNYLTKVKGPRKVGKKVFMQGGVAKNSSIAYAFALATNKHIIVPPNPELMGAYGVALMALEKEELGLLEMETMETSVLLHNEMKYLGNFTCRACNNYCTINRYQVNDRKFPFGGACSKYESSWSRTKSTDEARDYVSERNAIMLGVENPSNSKTIIGIPRALTTHFLFPLYQTFLKELGFRTVLSDIDERGELYINAPFCFPTQIAHGAVLDLIEKKHVDYIFFPHIIKMPFSLDRKSYICPITQASPFVLKKAFEETKILSPSLDFQHGYENCKQLIKMAVEDLEMDEREVKTAYARAINKQILVEKQLQQLGKEALEEAISTNKTAIVLMGRSYNAFPNETSQSLGRKLASKGIITIPFDCLGKQESTETSWYFSNLILDAVKYTQKYDNVFGLFVSNFGCNIDNFNLEFFRRAMHDKPYLKLDIDSHSADAGTQTRIEAFLEIIANYQRKHTSDTGDDFILSEIIEKDGDFKVKTSSNELLEINDKRITYHFPVFTKYHNEIFYYAFRWMGLTAGHPLSLSTEQLNRGLQYTSGNECLPLPIFIGQMLEIYEQKKPGEIIGVYMIAGGEPCVVASYSGVLRKFIMDHKLTDIFLFEPHLEMNNVYNLSKIGIFRTLPIGFIIGDIITEIFYVLKTVGGKNAISQLDTYWQELLNHAETRDSFNEYLPTFIDKLTQIEVHSDPKLHPKIVISGDFFVRFDEFFFKGLPERYAEKGIILKPVDLSELLIYGSYDDMIIYSKEINATPHTKKGLFKAMRSIRQPSGRKYMASWAYAKLIEKIERDYREKFEETGLLIAEPNKLGQVINYANEHIDPSIMGETILTVGKAVEAMSEDYQGILVLGPFSCLPFRISEAILKPLSLENNFPFLSFETDGRAIPPSFLRLVDVHIQQIIRNQEDHIVSLPIFEGSKRI
ncbi:MAG: hypothetical protein INQ03_23495 [Candidatus Heimdallarchaeota archaeon]|nr:hypothetical protein [Candidatus Heimdallarchaeota archaeon]